MIEPDNQDLPVQKQCSLIRLRRGTWYDRQKKPEEKNAQAEKKAREEKALSELILSIYADRICLGSRGMRDELKRRGHVVNRKKVQRLMRHLGLKSQAPGPHTSIPRKENPVYPYLLKDAVIKDVDEVWSTDITYVRVGKGFMYLTAIIDWYSRYIVAWDLSNSMDVHAQLKVLDKALASGRKPKVFNTDQGSQFTSLDFTQRLKDNEIHISMDAKGRAVDNVFIERFWRTIKYEWLRFWTYDNGHQLRTSIAEFIELYNFRRCHSAIYAVAPCDIYISGLPAPDLSINWEHRKGEPLRTIDEICFELPKVSVPLQKKSVMKKNEEEKALAIST